MPVETVAVIIPTFNRGSKILSAIKSVEQQSYESIHLIVVVDGSTDESMSILQAYKSALPKAMKERMDVIFQENRGVSAARNNGIRASDANFIALLDDDDQWFPEKLAKQMQAISGRVMSETFLCTTNFYNVTNNTETELIDCAVCVTLSGQIRLGRFPPPSSWLFSRDTYEIVGGFDESLHAGEDVDFVTNLRRKDVTICNLSEALTLYMDSPGKVYRDQEAGAVTTLMRHHAWWQNVLSANDYNNIMRWYSRILPAELYQATMSQLLNDRRKPVLSGGQV